MVAQALHDAMADERGHQHWHHRSEAGRSEGSNFEGEHRPGQRHAEHRPEPAPNGGDGQTAPILAASAHRSTQPICEAGRQLQGGAFPAG